MTQFVRAANPIWWLPDETGVSLNDLYFAFFLTNDLPYIPQPVFQDPNGLIPWSDPIQFEPSGTLPNNLYFDETLTYRIEIRKGPTQAATLIWLIENFQAGQGITTSDALITSENLATNPQFADIFFSSPDTIDEAGTYTIAPGWQLTLTGSGSTTLTQVATAGDAQEFGNPPYYLTINNSGWASAILSTTFNNNGALFAGGAIAVSFLSFATTSAQTLSVIYAPNGPANSQDIFSGSIMTGDFMTYAGSLSPIRASLNNQTGMDANVQIQFVLPPSGIISLTNIFIAGQSIPLSPAFDPATDIPTFPEQSYERIVDHEFHVYKTSLVQQAKNSLLAGWIFGLNPFQFQPSNLQTIGSQVQYIADQTILIQRAGNRIQSGQAGEAFNAALQLAAVGAGAPVDNRLAILQYLDNEVVQPYAGQNVSVLVRSVLALANSVGVPIKMRLIYRNGLPPDISPTEPIASWTVGDDPTFSAGWTEIVPSNDPAYIVGNTFANADDGGTDFPAYAFDQFLLPNVTNGFYLGVLVYTMTNLDNTMAAPNSIYFDRISLVPNDFAIDASETKDEAIRKCQYYYSKSYSLETQPGANTFDGATIAEAITNFNSSVSHFYNASFSFNLKQLMRNSPVITFYASDSANTPNFLTAGILRNGNFAGGATPSNPIHLASSEWDLTETPDSVTATAQSTTGARITLGDQSPGDQSVIYVQYTADARLGVN
jgi:hypothetical protein